MKGNGCADASRIDASGRQQEPLNSEHTRGPWLTSTLGVIGKDAVSIWDGNGIERELATVHFPQGRFPNPHGNAYAERDANARLIAAAPDLLEALKGILRNATKVDAQGRETSIDLPAFNADVIKDLARAAIRKAEGA